MRQVQRAEETGAENILVTKSHTSTERIGRVVLVQFGSGCVQSAKVHGVLYGTILITPHHLAIAFE